MSLYAIHICMYIYVYMYVYVYIYAYIHIYIYIHIYKYKLIILCRTVLPSCMSIFLTIFGEICMVHHNNT